MECSFETRKTELQQEIIAGRDLFSKELAKLSEFMKRLYGAVCPTAAAESYSVG